MHTVGVFPLAPKYKVQKKQTQNHSTYIRRYFGRFCKIEMETLAMFTVVTMHNKESHDTARYVCRRRRLRYLKY